jgi:Cytochrome c7 and related cytochrome c
VNRFLSMAVILYLTLMLSSTLVLAAEKKTLPANRGPEIINFKMGAIDLQFQHWKHLTSLQVECFNCHKTKIGKIDGWNKEFAHKICIPCHDLGNKGPVDCHECHKY